MNTCVLNGQKHEGFNFSHYEGDEIINLLIKSLTKKFLKNKLLKRSNLFGPSQESLKALVDLAK